MRNFGYIRVSSRDQNEERQIIALHEFGICNEDIFIDKQSGKDFNRPEYMHMVEQIHSGDLIVVKSIDRLGRNYNEILEQWRSLTKEKEVDICVLDMPLLDTRRNRDLLGTLIADIVLQLLSYVAQTEREFIKQRQAEGIAAAKARGVHMGRPAIPVPDDFSEIIRLWEHKKLSIDEVLKRCNMCETTFYKRLNEHRIIEQYKKKAP